MSAIALANLEAAANTQPHHTAAARAFVRVCHADCGLTYGQTEEWTRRRAAQHEFQIAVDAGREDLVAELELLRERIGALVERAAELDPKDAGRVRVFLRQDLVLTLGSSRDDEHTLRREAMLSGRHPAGRALRTPTLNDFAD